jgi:hypothetical protein
MIIKSVIIYESENSEANVLCKYLYDLGLELK